MIAFYILVAHLVGDFLLQDDWMQQKSKDSSVCAVHVGAYVFFLWPVLPIPIVVAIAIQHFFQDRFALHLRWMRIFGQTPPDRWPVGPLCMDQALHLAFIALACWIGGVR